MIPTKASTAQANKFKRMMAEKIQKNRRALWDWHLNHARVAPPPFYCSVDLRDSGHKIVPVDSNLFPAGFNNICPEDMRAAPAVMRAQVEAVAARLGLGTSKRILVLPEAHTSNGYYIENLHYLTQLLSGAGFEVALGWWGPMPEGSQDQLRLKSVTGKELVARPLTIQGGVASVGEFVPDLVLLNNDFSSGYPLELDAVTQPILPSHTLGWHSRKKSTHFKHYNQLAGEFANIIDIDPWTISIDTEEVAPVDFGNDQGIDAVAAAVGRVLERTRAGYATHGVDIPPFVFVKNNAGTYGMGIMVVHSAEEVHAMNRRAKNKMSVGKNKLQIQSVAVQEGIPTATLVDRLAAEPVIYLVGTELIGGFLRTNTEKGVEENLNSQGMVFRKLCMSDLRRPTLEGEETEEETSEPAKKSPAEVGGEPLLELVYGSIARISALATGRELAEHVRKA